MAVEVEEAGIVTVVDTSAVAALSTDRDHFFATEWLTTARRLTHVLASYGTTPADSEDILQETALRLFRVWTGLDRTRSADAYAYARTIALNILRDEYRRPFRRRELLQESIVDTASHEDPARTAIARIELDRVAHAMRGMRTTERRALTETIEDGGDRPSSGAAKRMARMRARRTLTTLLREHDASHRGASRARSSNRDGRSAALR